MKMNLGFTVIANCVDTQIEPTTPIGKRESKEVRLEFDIESAQKFLFRFGPETFDLSDSIKVMFLKNKDKEIISILLIIKDDSSYIITNYEQIFRDIHEGYMKLSALEKITNILDFDFEAGLDFQK